MIQLGVKAFSRLSQAIVHLSYTLDNGERPLPAGQELAGSIQDQKEDPITHPELTYLGPPVVVRLLPLLGPRQMFTYYGKSSSYFLWHVLHVFYDRPERSGLIFPGFFGDVQESAWAPSEK